MPPTSVVRCDIVKPATPASASCTTEIWPTKPMMTTSERQMTTPSSELISACRKSYGKTIRQTTPTTAAIAVGRSSRSGRGTAGRRFSTSSPRPGRLAPRRNSASDDDEEDEQLGQPAKRRSARVGREPALRRPVDRGAHWITPIASPAKQAMKNDVKPASSAAASAGTTWNASVCASSAISGATRTPSPPATTHARTVFDDRQAARREAGEHRRDLVLRRRPRREAEGRPAVQRREHRRDDDHDPGEQKAVLRHDAAEDRDRVGRAGSRAPTSAVAEDRRSPRPAARAGGRATQRASRAAPCSGAGGRWSARSGRRARPCRRASGRTPARSRAWKPK